MDEYGKELIIDLKECDVSRFTRAALKDFCVQLCKTIDMKPAKICFWDYDGDEPAKAEAPAHLAGTSVVQFIETSNITIHALDKLKEVYINIFSCKPFVHHRALQFAIDYFDGRVVKTTIVTRGVA